jgi:RNA polymerase sigma-70 factor (ECF subfamily)
MAENSPVVGDGRAVSAAPADPAIGDIDADRADSMGGPIIVDAATVDAACQLPADLTRLVADHHAAVYGYAYRLTGSVQDAEDLTQQAFLAAQTSLTQLRQTQNARSWLYAIARNTWLKARRKRIPLAAADLDLPLDQVPDDLPEEPLVDAEQLQAALDELPDEFRLVLVMFYYEGCSYRQLAEQLELPMGTVMSRLSRAKSHLRARLLEPTLYEPTLTESTCLAANGAHAVENALSAGNK